MDDILKIAATFVNKHKRYPSLIDMASLGVTRAQVRTQYGHLDGLKNALTDYGVDILDIERHEYNTELPSSKRYIFTTAVTDSEVHEGFLKNIKAYCKKNKASLGCFVSQLNSRNGWVVDTALSEETFIIKDVMLNDNLFLLGIKNKASKTDPVTGLPRIGKRNGTFIGASPKQRLKYVASGANKLPYALMTTGAITKPNYIQSDVLVDSGSYIADNDHKIGAVIVELDKDNTFHFRQIQADKDGSFCDLGKMWKNGKETKVAPILIPGDWHCGSVDKTLRAETIALSNRLGIKEWIMHDVFDGYSINHHEKDKLLLLTNKAKNGQLSLEDELHNYIVELNTLSKNRKLTIVASNHDRFLEDYLQSGDYVKHPYNHRIALVLSLAMLDGVNPLEYYYKANYLKCPNIRWLKMDESYVKAGYECGMHGHHGSNGARGNITGMEMSYGKVIFGHRHSPEILRDAICMGTSTHLQLLYNKGASSWVQTHCLLYPNGSRQLINFINGKFHL